MRVCNRCIQPDTRPGIYFNDQGVCGACLWEEEKKEIDWESREKELEGIVDWAKNTAKGNYDCAIGVSGGKDSTKQALTARDKLGLRCLLVNCEPEGITEIGRHNIENLKKLGFDVINLRPNPKVMKLLIKRDFYKYLNPVKITEFPLYASTYIITKFFNICFRALSIVFFYQLYSFSSCYSAFPKIIASMIHALTKSKFYVF